MRGFTKLLSNALLQHKKSKFICCEVQYACNQLMSSTIGAAQQGKDTRFKKCSNSEPMLCQTAWTHSDQYPKLPISQEMILSNKKKSEQNLHPAKFPLQNKESVPADRPCIINIYLNNEKISKGESINIAVKGLNIKPHDICVKRLKENIENNFPMIDQICQENLNQLSEKSFFAAQFEKLWANMFKQSKNIVGFKKSLAGKPQENVERKQQNTSSKNVGETNLKFSNNASEKLSKMNEDLLEESNEHKLLKGAEKYSKDQIFDEQKHLDSLKGSQKSFNESSVKSDYKTERVQKEKMENFEDEGIESTKINSSEVTLQVTDLPQKPNIKAKNIDSMADETNTSPTSTSTQNQVLTETSLDEESQNLENKKIFKENILNVNIKRNDEEHVEVDNFKTEAVGSTKANEVSSDNEVVLKERVLQETDIKDDILDTSPKIVSSENKTLKKRNELTSAEAQLEEDKFNNEGEDIKEEILRKSSEKNSPKNEISNKTVASDHKPISQTQNANISHIPLSISRKKRKASKEKIKKIKEVSNEALPAMNSKKSASNKQTHPKLFVDNMSPGIKKINNIDNSSPNENAKEQKCTNAKNKSPSNAVKITSVPLNPTEIFNNPSKPKLSTNLSKTFKKSPKQTEQKRPISKRTRERLKQLNQKTQTQIQNVIKLASKPRPQTAITKVMQFCKGLFKEDEEFVAKQVLQETRKQHEDTLVDGQLLPQKITFSNNNMIQYRYLVPPPAKSDYKLNNVKSKWQDHRIGSMLDVIQNEKIFQQKSGVRERMLPTSSKYISQFNQSKINYSTAICCQKYESEKVKVNEENDLKSQQVEDKLNQKNIGTKKKFFGCNNKQNLKERQTYLASEQDKIYKQNKIDKTNKHPKQNFNNGSTWKVLQKAMENRSIFQSKSSIKRNNLAASTSKLLSGPSSMRTQQKLSYSSNKDDNCGEHSEDRCHEPEDDPCKEILQKECVVECKKRCRKEHDSCQTKQGYQPSFNESDYGLDKKVGETRFSNICKNLKGNEKAGKGKEKEPPNKCETKEELEKIKAGVLGCTSKCFVNRNPDVPAVPCEVEVCENDQDYKSDIPDVDVMQDIGHLMDNDPNCEIANYYGANGYKNLEYYKFYPCSYYEIYRYLSKKRNPQPDAFAHKKSKKTKNSKKREECHC